MNSQQQPAQPRPRVPSPEEKATPPPCTLAEEHDWRTEYQEEIKPGLDLRHQACPCGQERRIYWIQPPAPPDATGNQAPETGNKERQLNSGQLARSQPAGSNTSGRTAREDVRRAALKGAGSIAHRLGLRFLAEESRQREKETIQANPELAAKLSKMPDLILRADDGQDNIHHIAVMTPSQPEPEDVRNARLAANLLRETTGRPAHAVVVEVRDEPEPDDESWNPVHWHTISRDQLGG